MQFNNNSKCHVLHLGLGNPGYAYELGDRGYRAAQWKELWMFGFMAS